MFIYVLVFDLVLLTDWTANPYLLMIDQTLTFNQAMTYTAKPSAENLDGILNKRTFALKYHLIISESPNLQVNSGAS